MKTNILLIVFIFNCIEVYAQIDSTLLRKTAHNSDSLSLNMDAVYNRPFLKNGRTTAVGGYLEANWQHLGSDGVSDGHQFQVRRMTLFVSSAINSRVSFMSEIEFEEGGKKIAIEFAALDIAFHPLLNLRTGIVMNPIGSFNQNHDGPKWAFTDRPFSATQLLPATWSNAGFGCFGQYYKKDWKLGYEAYVTGGFDQTIVENDQNKTYLPASKANSERFEEGNVLFTTKLAARHKKIGELGVSLMAGQYNTDQDDGIVLDVPQWVKAAAVDFTTTVPKINTKITGELTKVWIDIPMGYSQQFGEKQFGGFIDVVQPILKGRILNWDNARLNLAVRLEYVDWNVGSFQETGGDIGDELWSIMPGVSFRPTTETVIRLNYRYMHEIDLLGNPPAKTAGFIFGVSSYF
ncbi:MAG: hypothetical protein ACI9JN_000718 [Bacteroidia bacterium]|jgi:hypothetical protein